MLDATLFPYSELIGSMLYLVVRTRPDLALVVDVLSRFMLQPHVQHWRVVKQALRYVSDTVHLGIPYRGDDHTVCGFCDADYAGDPDKWSSTSGYLFLMAGGAVSWGSKLQPTEAALTCVAE
jgi:hypothetical protein